MVLNRDVNKTVGLLAPEINSSGGIQATMKSLIEVICDFVKDSNNRACCVSLNDKNSAMESLGSWSQNFKCRGFARSKIGLIIYMIFKFPRDTDVLIVGHIALSPVAYFLKLLGRVEKYYVIVYGIEVWKKIHFFQHIAINSAEKVISISQATMNEMVQFNGTDSEKFLIIPLCAEDRKMVRDTAFKLNGEFKLLCVSRQDSSEKYKGFEDIFKVLLLLKKSHPDIHLNLVGHGNDQARLIDIAENMGIIDQISFLGYLTNQQLDTAYADCDLYIMPSKGEGFGIVFLEAMRHGKPCIGGNHGGTPEVIAHNSTGYLVDFGDVSRLAEYLVKLKSSPRLRTEFGLNGKNRVETYFSQKTFKKSFLDLLNQNL